MADNYIDLPAVGDEHWKAPVALTSALPSLGNSIGDIRLAEDTNTIYVWSGSTWVAVATPGAAIALDGLIGDVTATGPGVAPASLVATSNSTLTTLSALSLPGSQVSGDISGNAANITASSNSTLTTLSALSLPITQLTTAATDAATPNTLVLRDSAGNAQFGGIEMYNGGSFTNIGMGGVASTSVSYPVVIARTTTGGGTINLAINNPDTSAGAGCGIAMITEAGNSIGDITIFSTPTTAPDAYAGGAFVFRATQQTPALTLISDTVGGTINFFTDGYASSNQRMAISSLGVGIGTTTPDTTLHVYSTTPGSTPLINRAGIIAEGEGTTVGGRIAGRSWSDTQFPIFLGYKATGSKASPGPVNNFNAILGVVAVGYDSSTWTTGASIFMNATETWGTTAHGTQMNFSTTTNGTTTATERMRIDQSGNVGIGTMAPGNLLSLSSGSNVALSIAGAGNIATTANAGSATLPATPQGFLIVNIGGTNYKLPYYPV